MRTRIIILVLLGLATCATRAQAQSAGQSPFAEMHNRLTQAADAQLKALKAGSPEGLWAPGDAPGTSELSIRPERGVAGNESWRQPIRGVSLARIRAAQGQLFGLRVDAARIFVEEGVPLELLVVAEIESGFHPLALSPKGARGPWQLMPATAQRLGLRVDKQADERIHPERATRAAARYLRGLHEQFGDWLLALAAYNAGEQRVAKAVELGGTRDFWRLAELQLLPLETRRYVPAILGGRSAAQ